MIHFAIDFSVRIQMAAVLSTYFNQVYKERLSAGYWSYDVVQDCYMIRKYFQYIIELNSYDLMIS